MKRNSGDLRKPRIVMRSAAALLLVAAMVSMGAARAMSAEQAADAALEAPTTTEAPAGDRRLSELFYRLQVLQQEVQELRGIVEEQAHQLNRLARDQKEQYIDLDRRVAGLTSASGSAAGAGAAGAAAGVPSSATAATRPATAAASSEREAYQNAFDLMKARQFQESIAAFDKLISDYPNGQYTPNALYWLGELHLAQQNTEQARQAFAQVVNLYPDHPKVPDTLYKLGVAYHRLGDTGRARQYFDQVQSQYPQSSAAGLAASYAQEIQ